MNIETLNSLMSCPLFSGFSKEEIINMMHTVRYRILSYHQGDTIAIAGFPCIHADIVLSGEVVASLMGPSGRVIRITMHHSGNMLAPAFLFCDDNCYPVTVHATKNAQILRFTASDLEHLFGANPRLAKNYIRVVSNVVSFLTKKVGMLSMSVKEKVHLFLKEEKYRQQTNRILINMSRQELANHFCIQKYSLQRCLKEMKEKGEIELEGKYIKILK